MDVFVLTIITSDDTGVGVHATEKSAYAALAEYCRECWDEAREYDDELSEIPPADEDDLIEKYFNTMQDNESYAVYCRTIIEA